MVRSAVQETKLVSGVSKVSYILGYNYKNLRLKVSYKWFLKRGTYCIDDNFLLKQEISVSKYIYFYNQFNLI